jgi:hypothetical protein
VIARRPAPQKEALDLDLPEPVVKASARDADDASHKKAEGEPKITWTSYRVKGKPNRCDVCIKAMVDGGPWKAPNVAVEKRKVPGQEPEFYCYEHALVQRGQDGIAKRKKAR